MELLLKQRDLEFLLYEFLDTELLLDNERYREHDRETLDAVIEAGKKLAEDKFAPFASLLDANEPVFEGGEVKVIPELEQARLIRRGVLQELPLSHVTEVCNIHGWSRRQRVLILLPQMCRLMLMGFLLSA